MIDLVEILVLLVQLILIPALGFLLAQYYYPPIIQLRKLIGDISFALTYYANVFPMGKNDNGQEINLEAIEEAQDELRTLGARLRGARDSIPFYRIAAVLGFIPKWENTEKAARNLIGWSNYVYENGPEGGRGRHQFRELIAEALGIPKY